MQVNIVYKSGKEKALDMSLEVATNFLNFFSSYCGKYVIKDDRKWYAVDLDTIASIDIE